MFKKSKEIEIKPLQRLSEPKQEPNIVVKLAPTLEDKIETLDNFYMWLYSNNYDANNAAVLTKYKQILKEKERK